MNANSSPTDPPRPLSADAVKALSHPLRSRLVATLRSQGPSSATHLASLLGTNSGATSYHLRQLESAGLVEDTGDGVGRQRLWQATSTSHSWFASAYAGDEDALASLSWLDRDYVQHFASRGERWLDVADAWPLPWRDVLGLSDAGVLVTREQLVSLHDELSQLLERYRRVGQGNPRARRVHVYTGMFPIDLDAPRQ